MPTRPTAITQGVQVSVHTQFLPDQTSAERAAFCFAYKIYLHNQSDEPVQLLRRHWDIVDGFGKLRVVDGDGVIGQQPLLLPGDTHNYVSGAVLPTNVGRMSGFYTFVRPHTGETFEVQIPAFQLVAPYLDN